MSKIPFIRFASIIVMILITLVLSQITQSPSAIAHTCGQLLSCEYVGPGVECHSCGTAMSAGLYPNCYCVEHGKDDCSQLPYCRTLPRPGQPCEDCGSWAPTGSYPNCGCIAPNGSGNGNGHPPHSFCQMWQCPAGAAAIEEPDGSCCCPDWLDLTHHC